MCLFYSWIKSIIQWEKLHKCVCVCVLCLQYIVLFQWFMSSCWCCIDNQCLEHLSSCSLYPLSLHSLWLILSLSLSILTFSPSFSLIPFPTGLNTPFQPEKQGMSIPAASHLHITIPLSRSYHFFFHIVSSSVHLFLLALVLSLTPCEPITLPASLLISKWFSVHSGGPVVR